MHSPAAALTWEIWRRNRRLIGLMIGVFLFAWLFNQVLSPGITDRPLFDAIKGILMALSILSTFAIFNFTESTPGKEWTGFPYRLFTFPVSTLRFVGVPMVLGVTGIILVFAAWANLIYNHDEIKERGWFALVLGAYMVLYQAVLWSLAGFRIGRIIILGLTGPLFVCIGCLPFARDYATVWFSERFLSKLLVGIALAAFGTAWWSVARQRCGGGRRRSWLRALVEQIVDVLPRRKRGFRSPASAQFWLEWRRSGMLLPLLIGALLIVFIGPIAWTTANTPGASLWILFWTLALPPIVALPLGKGFSKPDFWSANLNLPAYVAVRPLATGEMVVIKMKVAALSAAISWLLVVMFLALWLPFRANLEMLTTMRIGLWMVYGHSVFAQYLIAALFVLAGMLLTWRFLVTGLWIGLAGNHRRFMGSAAIYSFALLAGLIGLTSLVNQDRAFRAWVREDPNRLLAGIEWAVALAVIAKFWLAARSWRDIAPERIRRFLLLWSGGTIALVALAILLWAHGTLSLALTDIADFLPLDVFRLRNLLILVALLIIPFARLGIAPKALAGNRHGGST